MGPVLVKQDLVEAKQTVDKRLEYIRKEMWVGGIANKYVLDWGGPILSWFLQDISGVGNELLVDILDYSIHLWDWCDGQCKKYSTKRFICRERFLFCCTINKDSTCKRYRIIWWVMVVISHCPARAMMPWWRRVARNKTVWLRNWQKCNKIINNRLCGQASDEVRVCNGVL